MSKPTKFTLKVFWEMYNGYGTHHNCHGRSEHGGRSRVLEGLIRRGWITRNYEFTKAGKAAYAEYFLGLKNQ